MSTRRNLLTSAMALPLLAHALPARAEDTPRRTADGSPFPSPGKRAWAAQIPTLRIGISGGENEADRLGR
ncbi:hypothetical protein MVG78_00670 [Roseomonas gilardii subsp. gilardii]|uniref:hypothetical protein n=1 Tax=Roseomonas gilardii TaxID=257708 RepID=UPI001FF7F164|nr:hypothetical protein [Roseomonas gilardii]UPG72750.1 hypothetical protein MVG78_00670 [Roseomonas gilardii subsp. gilardii]